MLHGSGVRGALLCASASASGVSGSLLWASVSVDFDDDGENVAVVVDVDIDALLVGREVVGFNEGGDVAVVVGADFGELSQHFACNSLLEPMHCQLDSSLRDCNDWNTFKHGSVSPTIDTTMTSLFKGNSVSPDRHRLHGFCGGSIQHAAEYNSWLVRHSSDPMVMPSSIKTSSTNSVQDNSVPS